jgi:hypothetical protein
LAHFEPFSKENDGFKYILMCVDVLSKRFFASPVKTKKFTDMKEAFEDLFAQMPQQPARIFSDRGSII